jgi:hypothetical protein
MRKEYHSPLSVVLSISTGSIITASDSDSMKAMVSDETTIDGDNAWSRRGQYDDSVWDIDDDE